jgi:hypothetical protein
LPNSLAYVFSDASAKDHILTDKVLPIILTKQVKVNFVLTGQCRLLYQNNAYDRIAAVSDGQVFQEDRDKVKDILAELFRDFEPKNQRLASFDFDKDVKSETLINVDASFSELTVSVSGKNSTLSITNHKNKSFPTRDGFKSANSTFVTFPVNDSIYHLKASADSAYSIRVKGISELSFEHGFSIATPHDYTETSYTPLLGRKHVLSVFVSDHKLVKCLTRATLIPVDEKESFDKVNITLLKNKPGTFSTIPIDIPSKMFKIKIFGFDKKGNLIERLISSGIESIRGGEF